MNNEKIPSWRLQPDGRGSTAMPEDPNNPKHPYNLREAMKDDDTTDPSLFELVKDHPQRPLIRKVRVIEGYIVCTFNPYGHLKIVGRTPDNGRPIPQELACTFTTLPTVTRAILKYLEKV